MRVLGYSAKDEFKKMFSDLTKWKTFKKQIPNLLTISRVLGPFFIVPMAINNNLWGATIIVFIVAFTDLIDGFVARKLNAVTQFGKDLDPVCDKFFVLGITIPLILYNLYYTITLFLEGIISRINYKYRFDGIAKSSKMGKIKTVALFSLLCFSYLSINKDIPKSIIPSLFTLTTILQIATIYNYNYIYKKNKS